MKKLIILILAITVLSLMFFVIATHNQYNKTKLVVDTVNLRFDSLGLESRFYNPLYYDSINEKIALLNSNMQKEIEKSWYQKHYTLNVKSFGDKLNDTLINFCNIIKHSEDSLKAEIDTLIGTTNGMFDSVYFLLDTRKNVGKDNRADAALIKLSVDSLNTQFLRVNDIVANRPVWARQLLDSIHINLNKLMEEISQ